MTNNVLIRLFKDENEQGKFFLVKEYESPQQIWLDVANIVSLFVNQNIEHSFDILYNDLCKRFKEIEYENELHKYVLDVCYKKDRIKYQLLKIESSGLMLHLCNSSRVIIKKNEGNCVDTFLEKGVKGIIDSIKEYVLDIESRKAQRSSSLEYHQTLCYEQDFNRISMINLLAEKLSKNCKTQLEKISEKYTKI